MALFARRPHLGFGTQRIDTERLILRRFRMSDAQDMFETWTSDAECARFMRWQQHKSPAETRETIAWWVHSYREGGYEWAITLRDGTLIGSIGIMDISRGERSGELGYCIARPYWNRGYGTEALRAVIAYMFDRVGLNRLEAYHAVGNPASGRIMEKCGMQKEGICRDKYRTADGLADCVHYAILARDARPL
ncbi:MAG: GNAT family N-acetyltransferase [Clostridia bacterium]|nr:GNAT family N-acetyltransferase [Clostridia bacterium]